MRFAAALPPISRRHTLFAGAAALSLPLYLAGAFFQPTSTIVFVASGADQSEDLIATIARAAAIGASVMITGGPVLATGQQIILAEGVTLDLNGRTLLATLHEANDCAVRMLSRCTLSNGTVKVRSLGRPSLQTGAHAPVVVGALNGEGGTAAETSRFEGAHGWRIADLVVESDKDAEERSIKAGAPGIQIFGGSYNGLIERVTVPDSACMQGGVMLDWSFVGPLSSTDVPGSRRAFDRGAAWSTHPHGIVVRDVRIGHLTRPQGFRTEGTFGVRLSGCYDIAVERVRVGGVTGAAFLHHAGDLGFEFARPTDRQHALRGNRFSDGEVAGALTGTLIRSDSFADNVGRAVAAGYRPQLPPIVETDVSFERIRGATDGQTGTAPGVRVDHQHGGVIRDCSVRGYRIGFLIDEAVDGLQLLRPEAIGSIEFGIQIEHDTNPPRNVVVVDPQVRLSGRGRGLTMPAGIFVGRSEGVSISGGTLPIDAIQRIGLRVTAAASRARVSGAAAQTLVRQ